MSDAEQKRIAEAGAAEPSDTGADAADAKQVLSEEKAAEAAEAKPAKAKAKKTKVRAKAGTETSAESKARSRKKAAEPEVEEAEVKAEEAQAEEAEEDAGEKPAPARRRRGAAETTAGRRKAAPARRSPEGEVIVRARARYVRCAPRKARLVVDHIRGKSVDEARAILVHTPRAAAEDVLKLLNSAVANAENNHELVADDLRIQRAYVDEGPTLKRYRPRALGRATRILKRTSHMTIQLSPKE